MTEAGPLTLEGLVAWLASHPSDADTLAAELSHGVSAADGGEVQRAGETVGDTGGDDEQWLVDLLASLPALLQTNGVTQWLMSLGLEEEAAEDEACELTEDGPLERGGMMAWLATHPDARAKLLEQAEAKSEGGNDPIETGSVPASPAAPRDRELEGAVEDEEEPPKPVDSPPARQVPAHLTSLLADLGLCRGVMHRSEVQTMRGIATALL
jgi:hypothetical protein